MADYYKMGLGLGDAWSEGKDALRNQKRQDERDAREKTDFDSRQAELAYQRGERQKVDTAFNDYQGMQTAGVGLPQQPMAGDGSYEPQGARAATPRDLNRGLGNIAAAKKDVQGIQAAQTQDKVLHRDEVYNGAGQEWQKMDADARAKWAFEGTSRYDGEVYISSQNKAGYTEVRLGKPTAADQKTLTLNAAETQQMFIASRLMSEGFGEEAQKILLAGGEKLRALAAEHNKYVAEAAKTGNDVVHKQNQDKSAAVTAEAARLRAQHSGAAETRANADSRRQDQQLALSQEAEGYRQGAIRAQGLGLTDAQRQYEELYAGVQVRGAGLGMKMPEVGIKRERPAPVLNDQQKIAYTEVVKELAALPPNGDPAAVYLKYGFKPEDFGVKDPVAELAELMRANRGGAGGKTATSGFRDVDGGYVERMTPKGPVRLSASETEIYRRHQNGDTLNPRERKLLGL